MRGLKENIPIYERDFKHSNSDLKSLHENYLKYFIHFPVLFHSEYANNYKLINLKVFNLI